MGSWRIEIEISEGVWAELVKVESAAGVAAILAAVTETAGLLNRKVRVTGEDLPLPAPKSY